MSFFRPQSPPSSTSTSRSTTPGSGQSSSSRNRMSWSSPSTSPPSSNGKLSPSPTFGRSLSPPLVNAEAFKLRSTVTHYEEIVRERDELVKKANEELLATRSHVRALNSQMEKMRNKLNDLGEVVKEKKQDGRMADRVEQLSRDIMAQKEAAHLAKQELAASRAFVSLDDVTDSATILESFESVNESIDEFCFGVIHGLPPKSQDRILSPSDIEFIKYTDVPILACFARELFEKVFKPFKRGMSALESDVLCRLEQRISVADSQAKSARWRAISYTHTLPGVEHDADCASKVADAVLDTLARMIRSLPPTPNNPRFTEETLSSLAYGFDAMRSNAIKVVNEALRWQHRVRRNFFTWTYSVYRPQDGDDFDGRRMRLGSEGGAAARANANAGKIGGSSNRFGSPSTRVVLGSVSLGLKMAQTVERDGRLEIVERICHKPEVLLETWPDVLQG